MEELLELRRYLEAGDYDALDRAAFEAFAGQYATDQLATIMSAAASDGAPGDSTRRADTDTAVGPNP